MAWESRASGMRYQIPRRAPTLSVNRGFSCPRNPPYPHFYPQTSVQHAVKPANRLGLDGGHDVRVAVEGDSYAGMAQHLGHDLGVHSGGQHQRGGRVAQVVEADGRQPFAAQQRSQAALGDA